MSYFLELSINLKKYTNSAIKKEIIDSAYNYKCQYHSDIYEFSGRRKQFYRNHYVLSFHFTDNIELLCDFIRYIKTKKSIYIENISYDDIVYKIIYASKTYLNIMQKEFALKYINDRKNGSLQEKNPLIFKTIHGKA